MNCYQTLLENFRLESVQMLMNASLSHLCPSMYRNEWKS